jgi:predicted Ser/Thr protein kinase
MLLLNLEIVSKKIDKYSYKLSNVIGRGMSSVVYKGVNE